MAENIYRAARKRAAKDNSALNNAEYAQDMIFIERTKLLCIEKGSITPDPDEVLRMAKAYGAPELCAHYCAKACPVGKYMDYPEIDCSSLSDIAAFLMSAVYFLDRTNDKIFKIFEDRKITENERREFNEILEKLDKVSDATEAIKLWAKKQGL